MYIDIYEDVCMGVLIGVKIFMRINICVVCVCPSLCVCMYVISTNRYKLYI
jgi:hypothetical protein